MPDSGSCYNFPEDRKKLPNGHVSNRSILHSLFSILVQQEPTKASRHQLPGSLDCGDNRFPDSVQWLARLLHIRAVHMGVSFGGGVFTPSHMHGL